MNEWMNQAKCVGLAPNWDAEHLDPLLKHDQAKKMCHGCPVIEQCLSYAARTYESGMSYVDYDVYELETKGVVMGGVVW